MARSHHLNAFPRLGNGRYLIAVSIVAFAAACSATPGVKAANSSVPSQANSTQGSSSPPAHNPVIGIGDIPENAPPTQCTDRGAYQATALAFAPDGSLYSANGLQGLRHYVPGTGWIAVTAAQAVDSVGQVAVGTDGTVYFESDPVVYAIDKSGSSRPFAGSPNTNGLAPDSDGLPATSVGLQKPSSLAVAPDGSLLVVELYANRIRRVDSSGKIGTVVGNGQPESPSGAPNGVKATTIGLDASWLATTPDGSIYFTDETTDALTLYRVDSSGGLHTVPLNQLTSQRDWVAPTNPRLPPIAGAPDNSVVLNENGYLWQLYPDGRVREFPNNPILIVGSGSPSQQIGPIAVSADGTVAAETEGDCTIHIRHI